ncbi:MAG TPA: hypothetical protein VN207_03030 [Ktedonobacteraceae bacterium]|nr:hypothetical protein [Ktedonobacteraceae bacterium]
MKHVSLSKIRPSVATKVSGLFVLAILAVAFLLFPLASSAMGCSGPPQKATLKGVESLFGPSCGGSSVTKNATIAGTTPKPNTSTADVIPSSALLSAVSKCKFVVVKPGQKPILQNGDIFLAQGVNGTDLVGIIVGSKARLLVADPTTGTHAVTINNKFNIGFLNAAVVTASGKIDVTPNDGAKDAKPASSTSSNGN